MAARVKPRAVPHPSSEVAASRSRALKRRLPWLALALGAVAVSLTAAGWQPTQGIAHFSPLALPVPVAAPSAPPEPPAEECQEGRGLVLPTGAVPALDCGQARKIVGQARRLLATPTDPVDRARFAQSVSDWLDPHGLWSVAPDAPTARSLRDLADRLVLDLESPGVTECAAALEAGAVVADWVEKLRTVADSARTLGRAQPIDHKTRWELLSNTPFEDGTVNRRALDLARLIGHGAGGSERGYGSALARYADVALERTLPVLPKEQWQKIVLAAAVRAYLPQLDPHGAWAPLDEETSIYDLDLEVLPPPRLWTEMTRTALGVRIDAGAKSPLKNGDVLLEIGGVALGGMSVEQGNQLAVMPDGDPVQVTFVRAGASSPSSVEVVVDPLLISPPPTSSEEGHGLSAREIGYGDGHVLVVRMPEVPDDLGDRLSATLFSEARAHPPRGVLLDLRGNGGGSTDGAESALGIFLPGAALFPMRRRDGEIEVDRAPRPDQTWSGPVAALVDGDSASAAEMMAGALIAYERGPVLGSRTYGKGCAQEYLDDEAGIGVLRLTTLVFALPDGSPLQRVGVSPEIALGLPKGLEREASLSHAPSSWRGPDVRDKAMIKPVPWPDHGGRVGVGTDATVYRALRALGASRAAAR